MTLKNGREVRGIFSAERLQPEDGPGALWVPEVMLQNGRDEGALGPTYEISIFRISWNKF